LADADGVIALDARIVVRPPASARPMAIRPYPAELETRLVLPGGEAFRMRPIVPADEPLLREMVAASTPADRRLRFLGSVREMSRAMAARLTQIDYDREMALIAAAGEGGAIAGVVRLIADPDNEAAEFAV